VTKVVDALSARPFDVMDNKEFSKELEKRTKKFALEVLRLSAGLPNSPEGRVIRKQFTKSGTSVGANYREANRARSRAEFKSRIKICESEASETQYWLDLIAGSNWCTEDKIKYIREECRQLLAIFSAIGTGT
jgi:four helix bundle protein